MIAQDFNWAVAAGGNANETSNSIAIDNLGNIYSVGFFKSAEADFDPSENVYNVSNQGGSDIFIQKLDAEGNFVWVKTIGDVTNETATDIAIDSNNNLYITGFFEETLDFDPSDGVANLTSESVSSNTFVLKLNSNGEFVWVKQFAGTTNTGKAIEVDANNNVYTTGSFIQGVDFDPSGATYELISTGAFDFYIQKMDSDGNFLWAHSFGSDSIGGSESCESISLDTNNNVLLVGRFSNTVDFDPSPDNEVELTGSGGTDTFILKLNTNGNFVWARNIGAGSIARGNGITSDHLNNVYVTGHFFETVDFDPSGGVFNISVNPNDTLGDIFILKLNSSGNFLWAHGYGGEGRDEGESLVTDNLGNLYILGDFKFTVDFDPTSNIQEFSTYNADAFSDVFLQKFDGNGNLNWTRTYGGVNDDSGNSVRFHNGKLFTTGVFEETVDFDPNDTSNEITSFGFNDTYILSLFENTLSTASYSETTLHIYPNPTERFITIETDTTIEDVQVYSLLGKQCDISSHYKTVDLINLSSGTYILKVTTRQGVITKKIIVYEKS